MEDKYIQITKAEAESLLDFIEIAFIEDVRNGECDNMEYVANICSVWAKAKKLIEVTE